MEPSDMTEVVVIERNMVVEGNQMRRITGTEKNLEKK